MLRSRTVRSVLRDLLLEQIVHAVPHFSHRPTEIDGEFALILWI
jgi:hypothetical protein